MEVVGYVRVSRVAGREGERFISPTEQRRAIEGWAASSGHHVAAWHEDLDEPGTRRDRPGLLAALEDPHAGVVVARLDRFGRSVPHLAALIEQLAERGAALFTVAEGINTAGPTGRMLATILSAIAEFDLARIRENWRAARAAAVERGMFVGGTVPMGYRKHEGRLEPGPDAGRVRELFERRIGGESWASLAESYGRSIGSVRHIIANRTYLGEVHGGGGLVRTGAHEPLVDVATFEAAQVAGQAPGSSGRATGLLSGLLRCAGCRYAMKVSQNVRPEYRCKAARRENAALCDAPASIGLHIVEPLVVERFMAEVGGSRMRRVREDEAGAVRALEVAEAELDAALSGSLAAILDSDRRLALVAERQRAVDRARERLARRPAPPAGDLEGLWPDLSLREQRQLLASALDCVFVRRGRGRRVHICWRGEAPELPRRGRRWTPAPFDFPP